MKIVTAMLDSKSKHRQEERLTKQPENKRKAEENVEQMELDNTIAGRTLGYTRNGQVYVGQVLKREYTY
ncbi:MAG: hypothetical protein NC307_01830 [Roseburia sp.]|nr:hypothetical protein [Roseburia sp.]